MSGSQGSMATSDYDTRSRDEVSATSSSFPPAGASLDYSNVDGDSEAYYNQQLAAGGGGGDNSSTYYKHDGDATEIVHEMHLALLYLLSNPDEFKKVLSQSNPPRFGDGALTLDQWNTAGDIDEEDEESVVTSGTASNVPLPYVVFADDSEVVLPQAHTASQLFGIEQVEGIELEAAAGIPALSQLFLRWLALMPGGDHLNIIDPPGLTVMRIAGGRYRVTAAHRVVWTWMNEFGSLSFCGEEDLTSSTGPALEMGDLVTLTIVDVFETDSQGKLLSYCPTFDNRAVRKTSHAAETIRKSSSKFFSLLNRAGKAVQQSEVNKKATKQLGKLAENVKHRVDEAVQHMNSPGRKALRQSSPTTGQEVSGSHDFEHALNEAEKAAIGSNSAEAPELLSHPEPLVKSDTDGETSRPSLYVSEASTEDEEVTQSASVQRV